MLRAEGIGMSGSKEANLCRRFYRILCVEFSPFGGEHGLVYCCPLDNCGVTASTPVSAFACEEYNETNPTTHY